MPKAIRKPQDVSSNVGTANRALAASGAAAVSRPASRKPLAEVIQNTYQAAAKVSRSLDRYVASIRAIQTISIPTGKTPKAQGIRRLHDAMTARNQSVQAENMEQLLIGLGELARAQAHLTVEIVDLYDAGDDAYHIWNGPRGYRVNAMTALDAIENVSILALMDNNSIDLLTTDWDRPVDVVAIREAVADYLKLAVPIWRGPNKIDLPTHAELQILNLQLSREGRAAMRAYGGYKTTELSLGEQHIWKTLDKVLLSGKELAAKCGCKVPMVKNHIAGIRKKRGRTAIQTRGKLGYYRPDSPPDWSAVVLPVRRRGSAR